MRFLLWCSLLILYSANSIFAEDFAQEQREAYAPISKIQEQLEQEINEGRVAEANQRLLAVFPKEKRTPAQTMMLGNMLYSMDPKLSYALHKEAAAQLPHEPIVLMEWAMEQHRAGDYVGALAAYDEFSKARPEFAPVHGLAADCLIRLGKTRDAVARWQQSEKAREGTLETLETLVCEIYKDATLQQRRSDLRAKTLKDDLDAAIQLIALDADFQRDWWNGGPQRTYLERDLTLLAKLPPNPRIKAAQCAGECKLKEEPKPEEIRAILDRYGFIVDAGKTLPTDPKILSLIIAAVTEAGVLTRDQAREQFGETLRAAAKSSKDADLMNLIANLYIGTPSMAEIEKQAWDATGDPRFAAGYLVEQRANKSLKPGDPLLAKAMKQFPEDAWIVSLAIDITEAPGEDLLVQGIRAEYRHFSAAGLILRPGAKALRTYFAQLAQVLK